MPRLQSLNPSTAANVRHGVDHQSRLEPAFRPIASGDYARMESGRSRRGTVIRFETMAGTSTEPLEPTAERLAAARMTGSGLRPSALPV